MSKVVDIDQRRRELADATARVIARAGTDGASMREVASEAGWTTGTLAHYFTDKRELLRYTLTASLTARRALRGDRATLDPYDAIRVSLTNALPITDEARLHWTVSIAFASSAVLDAALAEVQRDAYRDFRAHLSTLLTDAGSVRSEDAAIVEAERLIALVDGIALQTLFDPESWSPDRQLAALDAGMIVAR